MGNAHQKFREEENSNINTTQLLPTPSIRDQPSNSYRKEEANIKSAEFSFDNNDNFRSANRARVFYITEYIIDSAYALQDTQELVCLARRCAEHITGMENRIKSAKLEPQHSQQEHHEYLRQLPSEFALLRALWRVLCLVQIFKEREVHGYYNDKRNALNAGNDAIIILKKFVMPVLCGFKENNKDDNNNRWSNNNNNNSNNNKNNNDDHNLQKEKQPILYNTLHETSNSIPFDKATNSFNVNLNVDASSCRELKSHAELIHEFIKRVELIIKYDTSGDDGEMLFFHLCIEYGLLKIPSREMYETIEVKMPNVFSVSTSFVDRNTCDEVNSVKQSYIFSLLNSSSSSSSSSSSYKDENTRSEMEEVTHSQGKVLHIGTNNTVVSSEENKMIDSNNNIYASQTRTHSDERKISEVEQFYAFLIATCLRGRHIYTARRYFDKICEWKGEERKFINEHIEMQNNVRERCELLEPSNNFDFNIKEANYNIFSSKHDITNLTNIAKSVTKLDISEIAGNEANNHIASAADREVTNINNFTTTTVPITTAISSVTVDNETSVSNNRNFDIISPAVNVTMSPCQEESSTLSEKAIVTKHTSETLPSNIDDANIIFINEYVIFRYIAVLQAVHDNTRIVQIARQLIAANIKLNESNWTVLLIAAGETRAVDVVLTAYHIALHRLTALDDITHKQHHQETFSSNDANNDDNNININSNNNNNDNNTNEDVIEDSDSAEYYYNKSFTSHASDIKNIDDSSKSNEFNMLHQRLSAPERQITEYLLQTALNALSKCQVKSYEEKYLKPAYQHRLLHSTQEFYFVCLIQDAHNSLNPLSRVADIRRRMNEERLP